MVSWLLSWISLWTKSRMSDVIRRLNAPDDIRWHIPNSQMTHHQYISCYKYQHVRLGLCLGLWAHWARSDWINTMVLNKMAAILQKTFPNAFLELKLQYLMQMQIKICPWGINWQKHSIDLGNGLALHKWRAITWIDGVIDFWRHMESLCQIC